MRIAMLARMLPRPDYAGGVSGQVHLLANELQSSGHEVTVFALNRAPAESLYRSTVVGDSRVATGRGRTLYAFPWWLSRLDFDRFDVVHSHGDDHLLRTHCPVVRTFYGASRAESRFASTVRHRAYHWSMVIPERVSERRAAIRVAISTATLGYLSRPAVVIPCAFDPHVFSSSGEKSEQPSILFVGDLGTRKRAELLLQVFHDVVRRALPTAELWVVTGDRAEGDGVRWFGRVSADELVNLYRRAWVFCLPSRYEGFGVPYIEALACGTPIVATPNGGAEDVLEEGRGGRLVCESAVGDTLMQLLGDGALRASLATDGKEYVRKYQIRHIAERYTAIYEEAVANS
jgi:glycosyltransferase involved in cell wall biosynthesis